jgi:hypothetical protein
MVKCFICREEFRDRTQYDNYVNTGSKTPPSPVASGTPPPPPPVPPLPTTCVRLGASCKTFSNVPSACDSRRTNIPQLCYPIIGPKDSGKSYYLHTMTRNLVEGVDDKEIMEVLQKRKININSIFGYALQDIIDIRDKLENSTIDGTDKKADQNHIPIVLAYNYDKREQGRRERKTVDICFFDIAGANFHDSENFVETDRRIREATGLIVFIDPLQDAGLINLIKPEKQPNAPQFNDASKLIERLTQLPRRNKLQQKIDIPITFCLTMFDLLEHNVPDRIPEFYVHTKQLNNDKGDFNIKAIDNASKLVEDFVAKNTKVKTNFIKNNFLNYKWFALSTIGHDEIHNLYGQARQQKIEPRGIYAPLFWLLYKNNLLT